MTIEEQAWRAPWMSDDQWKCARVLAQAFRGFHHLVAKIHPYGFGIQLNSTQDLATYDSDLLTRLVVLAHDRMVRVSVGASGPNRVRVCLWVRKGRVGGLGERHPTLEDAVASIRKASLPSGSHNCYEAGCIPGYCQGGKAT